MSIQHLVNSYQPKSEVVDYGDTVKVAFIETPFNISFDKSQQLLTMLDGALKLSTKSVDGKVQPDIDLDFTAITSNFASGKAKSIIDFIRKNCRIQLLSNGDWLDVDVSKADQVDYVFNTNDGIYLNFLFDGVKFHFAKHLPSGTELLTGLANKMMNRLAITQPTNSQ